MPSLVWFSVNQTRPPLSTVIPASPALEVGTGHSSRFKAGVAAATGENARLLLDVNTITRMVATNTVLIVRMALPSNNL